MAQPKHPTRAMAEFAVGLEYDDLSTEAVAAAKRFLIDAIGCAFGGWRAEEAAIVRDSARDAGGTEESTLLVSGEQTSAASAALVNAHMVRVLDFNDVYWKQDACHPSVLVPVALAVAEREGRGGRDLLTAIVLGYEFEIRFCEAAAPGIGDRGWHPATFTGLVAPIVAGKMLDLSAERMASAIAISGARSCTLGVAAGDAAMLAGLADPLAAQGGVAAALLAERGLTGPEEVIDGAGGLAGALGPEWKLGALTDGLGESLRITQCAMKSFPTASLAHASLSALLKIVKSKRIAPDDVESIEVKTTRRAAETLAGPSAQNPATRRAAARSLPWCAAAAAARGRVTLAELDGDALADVTIRGLLGAVRVVGEPQFDALFPRLHAAEVTVVTRAGERYVERSEHAKGDARDPLTDEEVAEKFASLSEGLLSAKRRGEILAAIEEIEAVDNVIELAGLLVADRGMKG
jgi:2-methylcitrate dehydratase